MLNKLSPFFAILISIPMQIIPALIGLYGGFGAGTAYVFVRRLGEKGEHTPIIVFCFSVFSTLVTMPFIILEKCSP